MHENLKYTLKLDKNIKEFSEFEGKNPNNKDDRAEISDWQAVYADNKYGTHYLLYTKFLGEPNGEGFKVDKIQLYIQNYSGAVSIGFVNHAVIEEMPINDDDPDSDARFPNRKKYYFQMALKAMNAKESTLDYVPKDDLILKDGDIIMTDPIFVPVDSEISKIFDKENIAKSNFVDQIFMKRVGSDIFITAEGEELLVNLAMLKNGLVAESDLAKIDINVNHDVANSNSVIHNYKKLGLANREYPCIPIYSVCEIKK